MEGIKHTKLESNILQHKRVNRELLFLIGLMMMEVLFFPKFKGIMVVVSIIYFLIERRVRNRTREEIGLTFSSFLLKLKQNWQWITLVAVIMQCFYLMLYAKFFPEVLVHLLERLPIDINTVNSKLFVTILILAFGEEIVFRGLIQARLNKMMPVWAAIVCTSLLFAIMHFSTGSAAAVGIDLTTVFIDSVLLGILFARTNNIYITTLAHALANLVATYSLYLFF